MNILRWIIDVFVLLEIGTILFVAILWWVNGIPDRQAEKKERRGKLESLEANYKIKIRELEKLIKEQNKRITLLENKE